MRIRDGVVAEAKLKRSSARHASRRARQWNARTGGDSPRSPHIQSTSWRSLPSRARTGLTPAGVLIATEPSLWPTLAHSVRRQPVPLARSASIGDDPAVSELDSLIDEALAAPVAGWDFSWIAGRSTTEPPPWSYEEIVAAHAAHARAMLDMGTGGGEVLASLGARAPVTVATEAWAPNIPVARERLAPLGIAVVQVEGAPDNVDQPGPQGGALPFGDHAFDLVINRHEAFVATEVARVLEPGGTFLTQQADSGSYDDLRAALGQPQPPTPSWLGLAVEQCEAAGLTVVDTKLGDERLSFDDVGALVYFLRLVPWAVPGFEPREQRSTLEALHKRLEHAPLQIRQPRFMLTATRPPH